MGEWEPLRRQRCRAWRGSAARRPPPLLERSRRCAAAGAGPGLGVGGARRAEAGLRGWAGRAGSFHGAARRLGREASESVSQPRPVLLPPPPHRRSAMDSRKLSELRAFVRLCKQNPGLLHTEELAFLREWVERWVTGRAAAEVAVRGEGRPPQSGGAAAAGIGMRPG